MAILLTNYTFNCEHVILKLSISFNFPAFRQEIGLRDHLSIHDPKSYPARPGLLTKPRKTYVFTKILYCDQCSYTTKQPGSLKKHKNVHCGKWEYACHICDKEFRLATSLAKHLPIHNEARDYKCMQCKASFTKPHYLRIHIDGVHLRKRPHKCDHCNAAYLMSNDLRKHKLRRHKASQLLPPPITREKDNDSRNYTR